MSELPHVAASSLTVSGPEANPNGKTYYAQISFMPTEADAHRAHSAGAFSESP
jgi:hypothetical protein